MLTCRQAGRKLGLAPRTIWRACHDGDIPAIRLGRRGHWRISFQTIERIAAGQRAVASGESLAAVGLDPVADASELGLSQPFERRQVR